MNPPAIASNKVRHAGPNLGLVALIFTLLFNAGLYPLTVFVGQPSFPAPTAPADVIINFFQTHPSAVLICAFLHFAAAISFGVFTASIVSQLRFLGFRGAGANIALFGGLATAFDMLVSASVLWMMTRPGIVQDSMLLLALYYLQGALGGVGFSVPLGLLLAGISIPSAFLMLLPKPVIALGLLLAIIGELSWLNMVSSSALFLVPLTRFPAFIWLIATGFLFPKSIDTSTGTSPAYS
jgi:hypothetical protein